MLRVRKDFCKRARSFRLRHRGLRLCFAVAAGLFEVVPVDISLATVLTENPGG